MPELAEDSINWFEMKGIAVRLQGRIVLEKVDWNFGKIRGQREGRGVGKIGGLGGGISPWRGVDRRPGVWFSSELLSNSTALRRLHARGRALTVMP